MIYFLLTEIIVFNSGKEFRRFAATIIKGGNPSSLPVTAVSGRQPMA
jgi:hypothetical protein